MKAPRNILRSMVSERRWLQLRGLRKNRGWARHIAPMFSDDLSRLATLYGTDKNNHHYYTPIYERYLAPLRAEVEHVLEIGVGGGENPYQGGHSLRMWKSYFPKAQIYSFDLYAKDTLREDRITIFQCDQSDVAAQTRLRDQLPPLDVIIDDGSHINEHVLKSFSVFFPHLKPGGLYFVEDMQTSYWPEFGGDYPAPADSSLGLIRRLVDELNHSEVRDGKVPQPSPERRAFSVHCYHNLAVIEKFDEARHKDPPTRRNGPRAV